MAGTETGQLTVLAEGAETVAGRWDGGRALIAAADLDTVLGWHLNDQGLCRGDVCVPVRDRAALGPDGELDLAATAELLERPVRLEESLDLVAVGRSADERRVAREDRVVPPMELPDLTGKLHSTEEWRGRKTLLVAFASW